MRMPRAFAICLMAFIICAWVGSLFFASALAYPTSPRQHSAPAEADKVATSTPQSPPLSANGANRGTSVPATSTSRPVATRTILNENSAPTAEQILPLNTQLLVDGWLKQAKQSLLENRERNFAFGVRNSPASAFIWVDSNTAAGGDGSELRPFNRLQDGINAAVNGTQVTVRNGLYNEAIVMKPGITIVSQNQAKDVTIQSSNSPVVTCADNASLREVTLVSTSPANDHKVVACTGGAPILSGVVISRSDRVPGFPIYWVNTSSAALYNSAIFGYDGRAGSAIVVECGSVTMAYNLILSAIQWGGCTTAQPVRALIDSNALGAQLLFTASSAQSDPMLVEIYNNWIINSNIGFANGINPLLGGAHVANNTIVGGGTGAIHVSGNQWKLDVINNILAQSAFALYNADRAATFRAIENNLFWANQTRVFGLTDPLGSKGNIDRDPQFVNPSTGDWHIKSTSNAIDRGKTLTRVEFDFDGQRRPCDGNRNGQLNHDIGSDEYAINVPCITPTASATPTVTPTSDKTATPTVTPTGTPTVTATPTATIVVPPQPIKVYLPIIMS